MNKYKMSLRGVFPSDEALARCQDGQSPVKWNESFEKIGLFNRRLLR
jgi:hypothetical protein